MIELVIRVVASSVAVYDCHFKAKYQPEFEQIAAKRILLSNPCIVLHLLCHLHTV